jgi:hypothetical protein
MRAHSPPVLALLLSLVGVAGLQPLSAQDGGNRDATRRETAVDVELVPRPMGLAVRVDDGSIRIDGALDEAAWSEAPILTDFVQSQPSRGMPATQVTRVRIVYDDDRLYIGAEMNEDDPDAYVIQSLEEDFPGLSTRDADIFGIALDTFLDRRNSFLFLINPWGAYRDGQTFDDSRATDFGWDGVVNVRTRRHASGWTMEMSIQWSSLRFAPGDDTGGWGLNMLRRVRRLNEDSYWAPLDRRDPVHRMSRAGTLGGLQDLQGRRTLQVKPYLLGDDPAGRLLAERGGSFEAGLDLKVGVTSTLTFDGTVNTDFSQVEVDQERVNLTRFPLFFPEQREFFVENSGSFAFGDVTERGIRMGTSLRDFTLFHSRRIGLSGGAPVPIRAGGRLSGSVGDLEVGLLDIRTGGVDGAPGENFAVARVRTEVGDAADVGVMLLDRRSSGAGSDRSWNRSWGVDANGRRGGWLVNTYLAGSDGSDAAAEDRWAGRASLAYRDRVWDGSVQLRHMGEGFDPGMGFVRRSGVEQGYATVGVHLPGGSAVQEWAPWIALDYVTDLEGLLLSRSREAGLGVDLSDGSRVDVTLDQRHERLREPFVVREGAVVPRGAHDFDEWGLSFASSAARRLSGTVRGGWGGYFDGSRRSLGLDGRWLASARVAVDVTADYNRLELPGLAPFNSSAYGARLKLGLTTYLFASAYVQYNEAADQTVSNVRVNWIHAPLSNVFVVFTQRRVGGDGLLERVVTLKATKLLSF